MREFKFRAWDEQNKVMHSDFQYIQTGIGGADWTVFISDMHKLDMEPYPLKNPYFQQQLKKMQFTGIKDKNGLDIYEGDIIAKPENVWGIMVWKAPSFEVTVDKTQSSLYSLAYFEDAIVVGNIYENPELITSKIT